jgi:HK97 family phage prohead protease
MKLMTGTRASREIEHKSHAGERKSIDCGFDIRAVADDGMIEGYGSVFNVIDSYSDIIAPGAFKATLAEHKANGTMPAMLWQHDMREPIGVWTEMREDAAGLFVRGKIAAETTRGRDALALLKMKALNGLSIGFWSREWSYDADKDIRTLTAVDLAETSVVTMPANSKARVTSVKSIESLESIRDAEQMLRERGFSKTEAVALVAKIKGLRPGDPSQSGGPGDPVADELVAALKRRMFA